MLRRVAPLLALLFAFVASAANAATIDTVQPGYWEAIPNSDADAVNPCPGNNCAYSGNSGFSCIMNAWSGGAYDTTDDRLLIMGGGHACYAGSEVLAFDVNAEAWSRLTDPEPTPCKWCDHNSDGSPSSRHTYNDLVYDSQEHAFCSYNRGSSWPGGVEQPGQGGEGDGDSGNEVDCLRLSDNTWVPKASRPTSGTPYGNYSAFDHNTGVGYYQIQGNVNLGEFDYSTNAWTEHGRTGGMPIYMTMAACGDWLVATGGGSTKVYDLTAANPGSSAVSNPDTGPTTVKTTPAPGFACDSSRNIFVGWANGGSVFELDPNGWVWTEVTPDPGNTVVPQAGPNGTYGRFRYVPSKNAFVLVNETDEPVYVYKLTAGGGTTPPASSDWDARSTEAGVLMATRFDTEAEVTNWVHLDSGQNNVSWDQANKISGGGALRMDVLPTDGANSGSWRRWLADDQREFDPGDRIYIQYQVYIDPDYRSFAFPVSSGSGGQKFSIVSRCASDMNGTPCSPSGSNQLNEIVVQNTNQYGFLQGYNRNFEAKYPGWDQGVSTACNGSDFNRQPAIDLGPQTGGANACENDRMRYGALWSHYSGGAPRTEWPDPLMGGVPLPDGGWFTVYLDITFGVSSATNTNDTVIRLYTASNGGDYVKLVDQNVDLGDDPAHNALWLLPYETNRIASSRPPFKVLYDEVIVSTNPIAAPAYASSPDPDQLQVHPTNPRLLIDGNNNPVQLVGHQTTVDYQDDAWWGITLGDLWGWTDYTDYLDYIVAHGINYVRSWITWHTRDPDGGPDSILDTPATPMMYERSATSGANDGGNKFDLETLNQAFFDRVRERVSLMNDRGIYTSVMLFEIYGFMDLGSNSRWFNNPWNGSNNTQGVTLDSNGNSDGQGIEFFYDYLDTVPNTGGKTVWDLQVEYVEKMIDTLHDMPNVIWEIANELRADAWQNAMSAHIQAYETANYPGEEHLILISASGKDVNGNGSRRTEAEALAMDADIVNWHGNFYDEDNPPVHNWAKPVLADMDHIAAAATGETPVPVHPWKSVTRGYGFSRYDGQAFKVHATLEADQDLQRANIGAAADYLNVRANNLAAMTPQNALSDTTYCLCNAGQEYLILNPGTGSFDVHSLAVGATYGVEWFDPDLGTVVSTGTATPSSSSHTFTPPGGINDAVLFIQRQTSVDLTQYDLWFEDNFNGSGLPTDARAGDCAGAAVDAKGSSSDCGSHWGLDASARNNEQQCYREDLTNMEVSGGHLRLSVTKVDTAFTCTNSNAGIDGDPDIYQHWSGAIKTKGPTGGEDYLVGDDPAKGLPHGIYEMRVKVPAGRGTWPGAWLIGHNPDGAGADRGWPRRGEIDILEQVGYEAERNPPINRFHSTLHRCRAAIHDPVRCGEWPSASTGQGFTLDLNEPPSLNWHVFRLDWGPGYLRMYIDDVLVDQMSQLGGKTKSNGFERDDPDWGPDTNDWRFWPFDLGDNTQFAMILNLAWGGGWGGTDGTDESVFGSGPTYPDSVDYLIDYVRIYVPSTTARPRAGLNGAGRHPYQVPVLLEEDGDTLYSGWASLTDEWGYTTVPAVTVPDMAAARAECALGGASRPFGANDYIIFPGDDGLLELEKATLAYSGIYYQCPGNYMSKAGGVLNINASGTAQTDAGLVKWLCVSPTQVGQAQNPWQRNPSPDGAHGFASTHDYAVECVNPPIDLTGENYWFVHNATFHRSDWGTTKLVQFDDSVGHVFDRAWVDCSLYRANLQGEGGNCVQYDGVSDNNVFQNGAVGPQAAYFNMETIGLSMLTFGDNNILANNRIWNVGKSIQNGGNTSAGTSEGNKVINNDVMRLPNTYLSALGEAASQWYSRGVLCRDAGGSECSTNEATSISQRIFDPSVPPVSDLFDPNGVAGCGQTLISMKGGSQNPSNPALVMHNRVWGTRTLPVRCGGDGNLHGLSPLTASQNPANTVWRNNVGWDNAGGFNIPHTTTSGADYSGLVFEQNVLQMTGVDYSHLHNDQAAHETNFNCTGDCIPPLSSSIDFRFNTILANLEPANTPSDPFNKSYDRTFQNFDCNLIYNANSIGTDPTGTENVSVDGVFYVGGPTNTVSATAADVSGDYTFWADLAGTPFQVTLPNAIPPAGVSFEDHCTQTGPATDLQGEVRTAGATTPGAFIAGSTANPGTDPPLDPPGESGPPQPPTRVHIRVNAGGGDYQDDNGNTWEACNNASPQPCSYVTQSSNNTIVNNDAIANTAEDSLFQTLVYDLDAATDMIWNFPVPRIGRYEVNLYGAENNDNYTVPGGRVFHVRIEDVLVYNNLDHVAEAGATNAAYMRSHLAYVSDGSVTITFQSGGFDVPTISAIEIIELPPEKKPLPNEQGVTPLHVRPLVNAVDECRTGWHCLVRPIPDVTLMPAGSDWTDLTQAVDDVFHLQPGDYRGRGVLSLTTDGASDTSRKWVRCLAGESRALKIDVAQCKLWGIEVDASNWVVEGVTFDQDGAAAKLAGLGDCSAAGVGGARVTPIKVGAASTAQANVLDGLLVEDFCHGNAVAQSEKAMVDFVGSDATDNYLQRTLMRDAPPIPNQRTAGVKVGCSATGNKISSGEAYDLTLAFDVDCPNTANEVRGTVIENNDVYQTNAYRTDCAGNLSPTGDCDASLVPIRINGSGTAAEPVQVIGNRAWGDRRTDSSVADWVEEDPAGVRIQADSPGYLGGSYTWIGGNIFDQVGAAFTCPVAGPSHVSYISNIAHISADPTMVGANAFIGDNLCVNGEIYHNRFTGDPPYSLSWTTGAADTDVRCNVFANSGSGTLAALSYDPSGAWDLNRFADVALASFGGTDTNEVGTVASQGLGDIRYWRRHLTSIEKAVIPAVRYTVNTPNRGLCTAFGQVLDRGVNDLYMYPKP